jgi:predicted Zn finger-like uncharacterized protein
MIVTCEKCSTQFAVPDELLKPKGKKVRCSKCAHVWLQLPLEMVVEPEVIAEITPPPKKLNYIPKGSNLPSVHKTRSAGLGLKISFVILVLAAVFLKAISNPHSSSDFAFLHNILGMYSTDGLVMDNITAVRQRNENKLEFVIKGLLKNESASAKKVPDIKITLLSKGGNTLGTLYVSPPKEILEAGEEVVFEPLVSNVSGNAVDLIIDLGNPWELAFR